MGPALSVLLLAGGLAAASEGLDGPRRIDKDLKLSVPIGRLEEVRSHIAERYREPGILRRFGGPGASQESASEDFTDVYYDTPDQALLDKDVEVRHRRRFTGGDIHYKIKEWVQVKLPTSESGAPQELKYRVRKRVAGEATLYGGEPVYPLLGLLRAADREAVKADFPRLFGVSPSDLVPVLTVRQHRDRIYISNGDGPAFTVSVDRVAARKFWARADFAEVEVEIDEVLYAGRPSTGEKLRLARLQQEIACDLMASFPALSPERASRYQKVWRGLRDRLRPLPLRTLFRLGLR